MKLIGKVNIKKNGDTAKSQEAYYDPKTDDLMLKGEASFKRGKDTLSGHEIKYSQSKGILQVFKASGQMQKSRLNGSM